MGDWWDDIWNWGSDAGTSAITDPGYSLGVDTSLSQFGSNLASGGEKEVSKGILDGIFGSGSSNSDLWGSLITAGGGLAQGYMAADQQNQANKISIDQANAQRAWLEAQAEKQRAASAAQHAATIAAQKKIAQMNNMANLYQTWGQLNQRAGEAQGESALATGRNASGAIMARAAGLR